MIDETNLAIEELEEEIRRENDRRYAFYRMLNATDRVLWRLEELNRDGVQGIPRGMRKRRREPLTELAPACLGVFPGSDHGPGGPDCAFEGAGGPIPWARRTFTIHAPDGSLVRSAASV